MTVSRRTALKAIAAAAGGTAVAPGRAEARAAKRSGKDDVGLLYDSVRCVGCRACQSACRAANKTPPSVVLVDGVAYDAPLDLNGTTLTVIKRWEDGPRSGFVKAQCMHCADPACVSVCMMKALHKEARGVVAYDADRCIGCRYCQLACPFNVPRFEWSRAAPRITKCELCRHRFQEGKGPACAEVCPRGALVFGKRADLLDEAHRRIEEQPEAYNGRVYGEWEGGGTAVLYIAAAPFSKLGLPELSAEPVPQLGETIQHGIYQGFIAPAALFGALAFVAWRNRRASAESAEKKEEP